MNEVVVVIMQTIWGLTPVTILILEILHYKERRDLYSRIMAKSLPEYTAHQEAKKAQVKETQKRELVQI